MVENANPVGAGLPAKAASSLIAHEDAFAGKPAATGFGISARSLSYIHIPLAASLAIGRAAHAPRIIAGSPAHFYT
jgi:hypothetical protein